MSPLRLLTPTACGALALDAALAAQEPAIANASSTATCSNRPMPSAPVPPTRGGPRATPAPPRRVHTLAAVSLPRTITFGSPCRTPQA